MEAPHAGYAVRLRQCRIVCNANAVLGRMPCNGKAVVAHFRVQVTNL